MPAPTAALPEMIYGTAWKEDETARLTRLALDHGFRAVDTANQRKHYVEEAVGDAIAGAITDGVVRREDVFLQTKFTFLRGQDERLPYDPKAAVGEQLVQSFANSLAHLNADYLDSYLLHGPTRRSGLNPPDWAAWRAMEQLVSDGQVRHIGVSNFNLEQIKALCADARVAPSFVQNRCYASRGWDADMREFCRARNITYQGFSLLTANRKDLNNDRIREISQRHRKTVAQIVFRFAQAVGMIPLTGTSQAAHMRGDLDIDDFNLDGDEVQEIQSIASDPPAT